MTIAERIQERKNREQNHNARGTAPQRKELWSDSCGWHGVTSVAIRPGSRQTHAKTVNPNPPPKKAKSRPESRPNKGAPDVQT